MTTSLISDRSAADVEAPQKSARPAVALHHHHLALELDDQCAAVNMRLIAGVRKATLGTHLFLEGSLGKLQGQFSKNTLPTYKALCKKAEAKCEDGFSLAYALRQAFETALQTAEQSKVFRAVVVFNVNSRLWPVKPQGSLKQNTMAKAIAELSEDIDSRVMSGSLDFSMSIIGVGGTTGKIHQLLGKYIYVIPQVTLILKPQMLETKNLCYEDIV